MNSQEITSTYLVDELQNYYHDILTQHEWYQQIINHKTCSVKCKCMPTLQSISTLATFFESGLLLYTAKVELPIVGDTAVHQINSLERKVHSKYTARHFEQFCLTEGTGACLCYMTDGALKLVPPYLIPGNRDIVSVIQFASAITDFSNRGLGLFSDCVNLVYVPPIPDGVTDMSKAFKGCKSLCCPIYIPATVQDVTGMLDDCISFSSQIIGDTFLTCKGHEKYMNFYSHSY